MANGEGSVVEEVLVRGRYDGTEIEKGIPASVQKGVAAARGPITDFNQELVKMVKAADPGLLQRYVASWKATKQPVEDVVAILREAGKTTEEIRLLMDKGGWAARQYNKALGETAATGKKTDWSIRGIAKSLEWAAYRFMFALVVYMAFRKVIRWVNEAITESIRLFRELSRAQQTLAANLQMNERIVGENVGTLEEWNRWIKETKDSWHTTSQAVLDAANNALQANATLRMSAEELQDVIELGRAVAIMYAQYKDGQLDVAKGVEVVTNAIAGQQSAMNQLGFTLNDVAKYAGMTTEEFSDLPDAMQASITRAYIMSQRFDDISESAQASASGVESFASVLDAAIAGEKANLGGLATFFSKLPGIIELVVLKVIELAVAWETRLNAGFRLTLIIIQAIMTRMGMAVAVQNELSDASQEGADAAIRSATAWQRFVEAAERAKGTAAKVKKIFDAVMGIKGKAMEAVAAAIDKAAEAFRNLGEAVADAMMEFDRATEKAGIEHWKDYAETFEDQKKDELELEEEYADKAADFRKDAFDKIAELRKRAAQDEKDDRADLNLKLHQMEEDHQLDMKHLRDQYVMDLEEAARTRDAVAIRRIQRQYGLEKRQREETYRLQQHQTVEAWKQDQSQRKQDLQIEIDEIRAALAEELAELRAEKAEELQDIRDNWNERRTELTNQYNQELADLKAALERRLTEAITEWADQNNIPRDAVTAAVAEMARQYGLDATNLSNMVTTELDVLETLRAAWDKVRLAAAGVPTGAIKKPAALGTKTVGMAEGGLALATAPTMVKVGEAGPELFGAMPLNKLGGMGGGAMGLRGGMDVRLTIDGTQSGAWSGDFETQVLRVFRGLLQESM